MNTTRKIDFGSIVADSPAAGLEVRAFAESDKQLRLLTITKDFVEEDWCVKDHAGFVVEGELEIDFDGEVITYRAGDGLLIQGDSKHKPKAISEIVKLFLVEDC
ncbi:MAG: cupin domain-containing protein [Acidobacteriota bacterium]